MERNGRSDDPSEATSRSGEPTAASQPTAAAQPADDEESTARRSSKYCRSCGAEIPAVAELCPECGVRIAGSPATQSEGTEPTSRLVAVVVGALVAFFVSIFVPIGGQLLGAGFSGYLRGNDATEGAIVGTLASLVSAIPGALVVVFFLGLFGFAALAEGGGTAGLLGFPLLLLVGVVVFTAAVGAIGGVAGAALSDRDAPAA